MPEVFNTLVSIGYLCISLCGTHGFQPRSEGFTNKMPARDTVDRLAYLR